MAETAVQNVADLIFSLPEELLEDASCLFLGDSEPFCWKIFAALSDDAI